MNNVLEGLGVVESSIRPELNFIPLWIIHIEASEKILRPLVTLFQVLEAPCLGLLGLVFPMENLLVKILAQRD